ncbi:hypothetical protein POSPLADRAFT_1041405, partial [Postia placenta MAD-698-R-SB12]
IESFDCRKIGRRCDYLVHWCGQPVSERSRVGLSDVPRSLNESLGRFHRRHPSLPRPHRVAAILGPLGISGWHLSTRFACVSCFTPSRLACSTLLFAFVAHHSSDTSRLIRTLCAHHDPCRPRFASSLATIPWSSSVAVLRGVG